MSLPDPKSPQWLGPKAYLYVSDEKVAVLSSRLPPSLRERFDLRVGAELPGIGSLEVGTQERDPDRFERAERLCKLLHEAGVIGDVYDDEKPFIRGTMLAAWGFWNRRDEGYADVVFFTAYPDSTTLLGLGGSAYHTMERAQDRLQRFSNSGIQGLMGWIRERSGDSNPGRHAYGLPGAWYHEIGDMDFDNDTVPEEIEFVAQRLLIEGEDAFRYILASPIYVARTGRPTTSQMRRRHSALRELYADAHGKGPRKRLFAARRYVGKPSYPHLPPLDDPTEGPKADW